MNPPNEREGRRLATDARGNHYNRGNRSIRRDCQECHDYEADPGDVLCYECKTRPAKLVVIPDVVERLALTAEPPSPASSGTIRAADVHAIQIDWLWEDRIPRGMVTVFTGPPKVGKSTILFDIAARASREGQHVRSRTCEHSRHCRASRSRGEPVHPGPFRKGSCSRDRGKRSSQWVLLLPDRRSAPGRCPRSFASTSRTRGRPPGSSATRSGLSESGPRRGRAGRSWLMRTDRARSGCSSPSSHRGLAPTG
jgi:hypothetical protein